MGDYRPKSPLEHVEAFQLTPENADDLVVWTGGRFVEEIEPLDENVTYVAINIPSLDGGMRASEGDYIIKLPNGRFSVMHPDAFQKMYERNTR